MIEQVEAELAARPGERWGIEVEVLRLGRAIDAAAAGEVQAAVDAVVAAARRADSRGALLGYAAQLIWKLHTGRMLFVAADTGARVAVDSGYSDVLVFGHSVVDAELGDEAARDRLGSLGRDRLRRRTDWTWGAWTALLARAAPIMSDRALALDVVDELLPMVEEFLLLTPDLAIGPVGWFVAETQLWVGDGPGAIHSALAGLSAARRRGSLPWVARSLLQVASVARATGHSLDLAAVLAEARRLSTAHHLDTTTRAVDAFVRAGPAVGRSEDEPLWMLAAGYSNKRIAEELSVSVKTVERMLSALYRRHGVRTRREAAALYTPGPAGSSCDPLGRRSTRATR